MPAITDDILIITMLLKEHSSVFNQTCAKNQSEQY